MLQFRETLTHAAEEDPFGIVVYLRLPNEASLSICQVSQGLRHARRRLRLAERAQAFLDIMQNDVWRGSGKAPAKVGIPQARDVELMGSTEY